MSGDPSHGYDAAADAFAAARTDAGLSIVRAWAASLPQGGAVVDVGAGAGEPLTPALLEAGLSVWAIDASPRLAAMHKQRFPQVQLACEAAETSHFFERRFDGALAVGLVFLQPADRQAELIGAIVKALEPGGSLLFSAPRQACSWTDTLTGRLSASLGEESYKRLLGELGARIVAQHIDEGGNHYFEARPA